MRGALLCLALGVSCAFSPAKMEAQERLRMGVAVSPDTVTVGDHFLVSLRVRGPLGYAFQFPEAPTAERLEAVESPRLVQADDTTAVEQTMVYRLVAWDTGHVAVPLGSIVATREGATRSFPVGDVRIQVRSVLPPDTTLHDPRPARSIFGWLRPWWHWLVVGLIALGLLAILLWILRRLLRRRPVTVEQVSAVQRAEVEFDRIDGLRLLEAGERARYVALYVEVMRDYLAARLSGAPTSLTSTELLDALREQREVPVEILAPMLAEADLIKFARRTVSEERARQIARDTRVVVRRTEAAVTARETVLSRSAEDSTEREMVGV
jgi:hypothetical protein